jgi:hypothetical protein
MTGQMKAFFEPENLNNASPATVSRAGIIYVSESELGWQPIVASWLQARKATEAAVLQPCFERYVNHMLDFIRCALSCEYFIKCERIPCDRSGSSALLCSSVEESRVSCLARDVQIATIRFICLQSSHKQSSHVVAYFMCNINSVSCKTASSNEQGYLHAQDKFEASDAQ